MNFRDAEPSLNDLAELNVTNFIPTTRSLAYTRYAKEGIHPTKRVVLLHGFTQSAASFTNIARKLALANDLEVFCVDLPCHGGSSKVTADLPQAAELLLKFDRESIWVGYSLGARHLLATCLQQPESRWKAVFSGLNPGIKDAAQRNQRYSADLLLADQLQKVSGDTAAFKNFLERWTSQPIFQPRELLSEDLEARIVNDPNALARSLIYTSVGKQQDYWQRLGELKGDFIFINGEKDKKYVEISHEIRLKLASDTNAMFKTIAGLGHSAVFDRPNTLIEAVVALATEENGES